MQSLSDYLAAGSIAASDFAKRLGVHKSHVSKIISGQREPSLDLAVRIEQETGGAVPVGGWPKFKVLTEHRAAQAAE